MHFAAVEVISLVLTGRKKVNIDIIVNVTNGQIKKKTHPRR